jgi:pilus assembly protein CpaC
MRKILVVLVLLFLAGFVYSEPLIEISIEITEVNENKSVELGISWPSDSGINYRGNLNSIPSIVATGDWVRNATFTSSLKALENHGYATILAKPKIITKSGTLASFSVGGEIPIATAAGFGATSVEWKPFGIKLSITPRVLKDDMIEIIVDAEISRIDNSLSVAGFPGIASRKATSNVEIKNGETMILAGLVQSTKEKQRTGIPFLCDIPLLGLLFSTTKDVVINTNVLIFITPRLIVQQK